MIVLYNINLIYNLDTVKEENKMLSKQQIQYYEKQYLTCFSDREKATIFLMIHKPVWMTFYWN